MNTLTSEVKECKRCGEEKPYSDFYFRSGYGTEENPATLSGHFNSECKTCMLDRTKSQKRLPPWESRVKSEQLAIDILLENGIWATTGKATNAPDVDVVAFGAVWIEVKHSYTNAISEKIEFQFATTPAQRKRGFLAHVVMLICEYDDSRKTYHLLPPDEPAFYQDGKMKTSFGFIPNRRKGDKRGGVETVLTQQLMDSAENNFELIWQHVRRVHALLKDGHRPEYGKPL